MAEYIEREAAVDAVTDIYYDTPEINLTAEKLEAAINGIQAAEVAPVVHGRWETNSDRPDSLICSVCKCGFDMWKHDPHNYCPNCGAKMDGGERRNAGSLRGNRERYVPH